MRRNLAPFILIGLMLTMPWAGVTETAALKKIPGNVDMIKNAISNNPHKRLTKPSDIADFIEMLLSYESSWMTGNIIRVDGGEDITG